MVVYCALSCATLLRELPHDSLRAFDEGWIASVSEEVMGRLLASDPSIPILYFSRSAYDQAILGLTDLDTDATIRNRIDRWSPQALDHALEWTARGERRSVALTAHAVRGASESTARLLGEHLSAGLDLLTAIAGTGRYDQMDFPDLLSAVVETEAKLIAELGESSEAGTRRQFSTALAQELKRYHRGEFAQALPYADPERGVWVSPVDEPLKTYLKFRGMAGAEWRGGIVVRLSLRAIEDFRKKGKTVAILYADPGALMQDLADLNNAQIVHQFEELSSANADARVRQTNEYLNMLRLNVAILRRALRGRSGKEDLGMVPLLDRQIASETRILAVQIVQTDSWLLPGDTADPLVRLRVAEEELTGDATFFLTLAQRQGNTYLVQRMGEILQRKREDRERLAMIRKVN
jgi:hypothetical protein